MFFFIFSAGRSVSVLFWDGLMKLNFECKLREGGCDEDVMCQVTSWFKNNPRGDKLIVYSTISFNVL